MAMEVVLYTRPGCCLCHDAAAIIEAEQPKYGFAFTTVDIDADPDLVARYGTTIPVVTVNGKERFRGIINPVLLRRLLRHGDAS